MKQLLFVQTTILFDIHQFLTTIPFPHFGHSRNICFFFRDKTLLYIIQKQHFIFLHFSYTFSHFHSSNFNLHAKASGNEFLVVREVQREKNNENDTIINKYISKNYISSYLSHITKLKNQIRINLKKRCLGIWPHL